MSDFFKRVKTNALVTAALCIALGLVLLLWPGVSAGVLCLAMGLILLACGLVDIAAFLRRRDGSLYAAAHLVTGVILAAVGVWLASSPGLVAVVIPRVIGILICIHSAGNLRDAAALRKSGSPRWSAALLLGLVTLVLGIVLVCNPFEAFATVARVIGVFLIYDGVSDIWITLQVGRALRQAEKDSNAVRDAVDVEYRDAGDE